MPGYNPGNQPGDPGSSRDRFAPLTRPPDNPFIRYPQEVPQFGPQRPPLPAKLPQAPQRDINFDLLAERIPRPDIGMAPVDAPDLRGARPLEMPPGNVPVPVETQQLRPEELDLSSRTPTKVNGVSIVDVGKVAVGFLSKIMEQKREEAKQAKTKEEADAAAKQAQLAKTIA